MCKTIMLARPSADIKDPIRLTVDRVRYPPAWDQASSSASSVATNGQGTGPDEHTDWESLLADYPPPSGADAECTDA